MNMNDPKDCPKRMEFPIRVLENHKDCTVAGEQKDQLNRAIALLKANESMCECGSMPGDGNAALWDLERSLAIHKDMHTAFQGTPKGEYHARSIREIEDALTILRNSMQAPKESPGNLATEATMTHPLFGTSDWEDYVKREWSKIELPIMDETNKKRDQIDIHFSGSDNLWHVTREGRIIASYKDHNEASINAELLRIRLQERTAAKASNLTFSEALDAVKSGKKVRRGAFGITLKGGGDMDLNVSFGDIASTDWSIVEER